MLMLSDLRLDPRDEDDLIWFFTEAEGEKHKTTGRHACGDGNDGLNRHPSDGQPFEPESLTNER